MSPIPIEMCLTSDDLTDPQVRPGEHKGQWISAITTRQNPLGAENSLQMWSVEGAHEITLLANPMPASGRGLSGGVHVWLRDGDGLLVVTKTDGIVIVEIDDITVLSVCTLAFDRTRSWSTPCIDYLGRTVYAIADMRELWAVDLETNSASLVHIQSDFVVDAIAGVAAMCVAWNSPNMPWTQSAVFPEGPEENIAFQQPRFSPDGFCFGFIDDAHGINNVRILGDEIIDEDVVILDDCEHGGPTWGPGQRSWCFNSDGTRVAYTRNEDGYSSLWVYDRATASRHRIGQGVHGCLSWEKDTLVAVRSGARTPQQLVTYDVRNLMQPLRVFSHSVADERWEKDEFKQELVEPVVCHALSDNVPIPYRLYQPKSPNNRLIVWVHGGPNDQWQVTFRPRLSYWLSRGYAIAVVDHRGTTGHGRNFLMALEGHWGDMDADDTLQVIRHAHETHGLLPENTVLMGGSAGGLTALNCIVKDASLVAGAVVSYPVVDLAEIIRGDDPFETPYMPILTGASGTNDLVLAQRSPHMHGQAFVNTPLLVFHGDMDFSVPIIHSQRLKAALEAAGGSVQLEVMEGEGHGFKKNVNVTSEYRLTEEFLSKLFTAKR